MCLSAGYNEGIKSALRYWPMHYALNATGRPILFSICDWQDAAATWAPPIGNSWRTTDDINTGWSSVMRNLLESDTYWQVAQPGQWNDPDMLEVGNGLTYNESVSHFSLWCLVKSPLILGNDIRNMSADTLHVLTNDEVIALNQDPLGVQGPPRLHHHPVRHLGRAPAGRQHRRRPLQPQRHTHGAGHHRQVDGHRAAHGGRRPR